MAISLTSDEVHLWQISEAHRLPKRLGPERFLNDNERQKAQRFKQPRHGIWWAFVHGALRDVLGAYIQQPAEELQFLTEARGKPYITGIASGDLFFNLSHSHRLAILAITKRCPVGVDIEWQTKTADMQNVVKRFFSVTEQCQFTQLPDHQKQQAFYRIWTQKEALIKANGAGLHAPLETFDVPIEKHSDWITPQLRSSLLNSGHYYLKELATLSGYQASLCLYSLKQKIPSLPTVTLFNYHPCYE